MAKLLARKGGGADGAGRKGARQKDARQKCAVKMQYSNSLGDHKFQLERYLVREGTDIDGKRAKLYGTDIEEYKANMAKRNFRIFISPQSPKADLAELTAKFVKKLELQTGYSLMWQAANHYNTAHPHAHLLINGADRHGRPVEFSKDTVKTFMRENARDTLTAMLGSRTRREMAAEREAELSARRYTRMDGTISELCGGSLRIRPERAGTDKARMLARLENLRKMGLCKWEGGGYKLSPRWEEDLRANGRYNTFLKARERLLHTHPSKLRVYSGEQGSATGRITSIYRTDGDASNAHALILECPDGKAWYVPTLRKPEAREQRGGRDKTALREGETATVSANEDQRGRLTPTIIRTGMPDGFDAKRETRNTQLRKGRRM